MDPIIVYTARSILGMILITGGAAISCRSWRSPAGTPIGTGIGVAIAVLGIKALFS